MSFFSWAFRQQQSWSSSKLYHVCRTHWFGIFLVLLLILGLGTRLWKVADVPAGMYWDEAAIGYNGHAIWRTRRDEWLVKLPVSFQSFGDYKAPLAIYVNGLFTSVLGMNVWAVRLPFVLSGVIAISMMVLLVRELFERFTIVPKASTEHVGLAKGLALIAGFFMVTTPWHFFLSRAGFESGMALAFVLTGMVSLVLALKNEELSWLVKMQARFLGKEKSFHMSSGIFFLLSAVSMVAAMYTYHSAKIVAPLLTVVTVFYFQIPWRRRWKEIVLATGMAMLLLTPLIRDTVIGKGAERLSQTSIFAVQNNVTVGFQLRALVENIITHLSPGFLLLGETDTLRHGDGEWGVLLVSQIILILIALSVAIFQFLSRRKNGTLYNAKLAGFAILWIVIGILPASIGLDVPHPNRAVLALPGFILLSIVGLEYLLSLLYRLKTASWWGIRMEVVDAVNLIRITVGMIVLVQGLVFLSFWQDYFRSYPARSAEAFSYGYEQAMRYAIEHEESVDKILFTSKYGQPYIYAIFFRETNPIWYQGGSLIKYEFSDRISESDLNRSNTVIVATPEEIDPKYGDELVIAPGGAVRFVLIRRP